MELQTGEGREVNMRTITEFWFTCLRISVVTWAVDSNAVHKSKPGKAIWGEFRANLEVNSDKCVFILEVMTIIGFRRETRHGPLQLNFWYQSTSTLLYYTLDD